MPSKQKRKVSLSLFFFFLCFVVVPVVISFLFFLLLLFFSLAVWFCFLAPRNDTTARCHRLICPQTARIWWRPGMLCTRMETTSHGMIDFFSLFQNKAQQPLLFLFSPTSNFWWLLFFMSSQGLCLGTRRRAIP